MAALSAAFYVPASAPVQAASVPPLDHVFVIVMENTSYSSIVGSSAAQYVNSLLPSSSLASNYFATTHPSLPNYLSLTGGSTFGITTDCTTCWISATNIADLVEGTGKSWKAYEESMPYACFVGDSYPYAQKHDPLIYYNDIRNNAGRCQSHIVPYTQMSADLRSAATTPNFAFITPNLCNDMHDCAIQTGDSWLQQNVPQILSSPAFTTQKSLLAITWDEDDSSGANQVATVFAGSDARAGYTSGINYNHYSLLHTIETALGLSSLTGNDSSATAMGDMVGLPAPPPDPWTAMYTLDSYGGVHDIDSSAPIANMPHFSAPLAKTVKVAPGATAASSGLILDAYGGLHAFGSMALPVAQSPYYPGHDLARDFVFLPNGTGGYELDAWGGIHPFSLGTNPLPPGPDQYPYFPGLYVAKKITLLADGSGGYVLDAYGGLHPWSVTGHPLPVAIWQYGYWPGRNIARDIWLDPGSSAAAASGYVLDGFGGFHPFWSATAAAPPAMAQYGYWYGQDIARAMWFMPSATAGTASGYVVDCAGGLHPFDAPGQALPGSPYRFPYWAGQDIARGIIGA